MAWLQEGRTTQRYLNDQTIPINGWGQGQLQVPFLGMKTVGFLRGVRVIMNPTLITGTHNAGSIAGQPRAQLPAWRTIQNFNFTVQGISPLYTLRGEHLLSLEYMRDGMPLKPSYPANYDATAAPSAPNGGAPTGNYLTSVAYSGNNATWTLALDIPLTEWVTWRDLVVPIVDSAGKEVSHVIMDRDTELGMITMQNSQLSVAPGINLNPAYNTTVNGLLLVTGNDTAVGNLSVRLDKDIWDVPPDPSDYPPAFYQGYIFTRQEVDNVVAGGAAAVNHKQAGYLMKVAHHFYDVNDNLVDISTTPAATVQFQWGASMYKYNETIQARLSRAAKYYEAPVPQGLYPHDFHARDGSISDFVDTANIPGVQTVFNGLPGACATVRSVEVRMIPVEV